MELLKGVDIEKRFGSVVALDNVSISVNEGIIFGLLGPNGAGKTTLIRIINRITAPDKGSVYFDGQVLNDSHTTQIGYLPEERGLYKKMTVGEHVLYLARLKGLTRVDAMQRIKQWFIKFEIESWWNRKVEELSKGMQQKVQFISTVIHQPRLLIFDEPFSGFDPINTNLLKEEILQLQAQGATIIFSTHNMTSVEEICDYIQLINNAKNILEGSIETIRNTYKTNTFEIVLDKPVDLDNYQSDKFELINRDVQGVCTKASFSLRNGVTTNELITGLLPLGNIISFNEVLPSMNDIFIRAVNAHSLSEV